MTMSEPAGWYDDPSGRHDHRYWDGARWTDQVANDGVTATDNPNRPASSVAGTESATTAGATRAQRQTVQRQVAQKPRKRWPWVLGGILAGFVILGVGCAAILGVAVNNAVNHFNAEQQAHAISQAQFDSIAIGTSQAQVISSLGRQPENTQQFVNKGILSTQDLTNSCIYYNRRGGKFGDRFQFCFMNDALNAKNSY